MFGKKFEKIGQCKSPQKRQGVITKYITLGAPGKPPNDLKEKVGKPKKYKAKVIGVEPKSPILREWLSRYNNPKALLPKRSNDVDDKFAKRVGKTRGDDKMNVENLPDVSLSYDKIEAKRRLKKFKYYAGRIAKYEEHRKIIEEVEELERKSGPTAFSPLKNSPQKRPTLDCTDMSKTDVKNALRDNLQYLDDITTGKIYSKRHEMFKTERTDNLTKDSLSYNVSMVAFTTKQKLCLSKALHKLFGDNVDYHMKVLLPELCLKIFMDRYDMSYDEAYQYLDDAPLTKHDQW